MSSSTVVSPERITLSMQPVHSCSCSHTTTGFLIALSVLGDHLGA